jgi:ATP-dependent helicase/nuclease subunit A
MLEKRAFLDLLRHPEDCERTALTHILTIYGKYNLKKILHELTEDSDTSSNSSAFFTQEREVILSAWQAFLDTKLQKIVDKKHKRAIDAFFADEKAMDALQIVKTAGEGLDSADKAVEYFNNIRPSIQKITKDTPPEEITQAITKILAQSLRGGTQKVWDKEELAEIRSQNNILRDRLKKLKEDPKLTINPNAAHTGVTFEIVADLLTVTQGYSHRLNEEMRKDGVLRFSDLISITKNFLAENQSIVEEIQGRYRYFFIDEFQDTDPTQFEIIKSIIGTFEECRGLFIVGDPNQSIYLFRDADVELFGNAQKTFKNSHAGEVVEFSACFRSTPEVIGTVNHVFSDIFPDKQADEWEFPHRKTNVSDKRKEDQGSVHILLAGETGNTDNAKIAKKKEAKLIAKTIKENLQTKKWKIKDKDTREEKDCEPKDIVILIEKRNYLAAYLSALEEAGLPFVVGKGVGFYTLPEVLDLYSVLSFIATPHDDCALLAVLRSPYFSLTDKSITILSLKSKGFCLWDKLSFSVKPEEKEKMEPLFEEEYERVCAAQKLLNDWKLSGWTKPLQTTINKILRESQIYDLYATLPNGVQKIGNIKKLIEIILERNTDAGYGIVDVVQDIKGSIESKELEGEAELARSDAITVMTMHGAKGLEFPVVILAGLSDEKSPYKLPIYIGRNPEECGIKVPDPDADYKMMPTSMFTALRLLYEEMELAEEKRLLYVGMTRARDHLILSGTRPEDKKYSVADGKSKLDWLCTAFKIDPQSPPPYIEFSVDGRDITIPVITDDGYESEYTREEQIFTHDGEIYSTRHKPAEKTEPKRGIIRIDMSNLKRKPSQSSSQPSPQSSEKNTFWISGSEHLEPNQRGDLIHEIFSGISADLVLKRYGIDDSEAIIDCQKYYEKFKTLEILQSVKEEYTELSCSLFLTKNECSVDSADDITNGIKLKGSIDRLCKTDAGWIIIDYKSGTADPKIYQPVLEIYCRAAEKLVKKPVTGYLYEIPSHTLILVERMDDESFSSIIAGKVDELLS